MDTSVLAIVSIGLGITMMVISVVTMTYNRTKDHNGSEKEAARVASDLTVTNTELKIDIQYIKTQLANIQTMVAVYTTDLQKLKDRMYCLETNCEMTHKINKKKGA